MAGHEAGGVTDQEDRGPGDLVGLGVAAERQAARQVALLDHLRYFSFIDERLGDMKDVRQCHRVADLFCGDGELFCEYPREQLAPQQVFSELGGLGVLVFDRV